MTTTEAVVKEWGNSLGIIIPKKLVRIENIAAGDVIKIDIIKDRKIDGFGIFKRARPFVEEDEHGDLW
jgi:antitoxin component of MazEF toxin-antitoxin module